MSKKRILFVDDEPYVLEGLRRMLRGLRQDWDMHFVGSGAAALELLTNERMDVVISDVRMPGMDGVELLTEVMARYPSTVRIALSGQSSREAALKSAGPAHQFLAKPCEAEMLRTTVLRACALRDRLANESLQQLVSSLTSLPSLPSLFREIIKELDSPHVSVQKLGELISQDVAMTAKILQLVNSAFFGLPRRVSSPVEAAVLLGTDTIKALVLSVGIFSQYRGVEFAIDELVRHSMAVGTGARRIAEAQRVSQECCDNSFMAGLLHDIGKLVLVQSFPEQYREITKIAEQAKIPLWQLEMEVLGASHADVGAYLLGIWGLTDSIVEAVAYHHAPHQCVAHAFSPLTAVHAADVFEGEQTPKQGFQLSLDEAYLQRLGLADRIGCWRDAFNRPVMTEGHCAVG